ncbi:ADP-ribosylglycohydrolase family protein [Mycobacterium sp. 852014-52144_SCH5372336]|uniref:ADP-ribosylglycohydrolase family protein n=1 Tax=Mycobacterium sp. 852014-52144_SCH5372336 TaxID=1834115 RepID=UPI0007FF149C|nr:ADP-ribosylglycohydrolase family protein [Mycobacterium sp. 852014-52144_SCH5372336]OBB71932.1 ADP-ribosylglycohydrolase [Mycobacterium sp. 852014-52144_SCH5372336]
MRERFKGCLLGGAVGDALGAPVEFMSWRNIVERFGADGVTDYVPAYGRIGAITDDTQMTMFTAEGLIRSFVRGSIKGITTEVGVTAHAYLRWLLTQGERPILTIDLLNEEEKGWLFGHAELHHRRAPGNTCVSALRSLGDLGDRARNDSKGCGGVMRVAPAGLFVARAGSTHDLEAAFGLGTELCAITHGHPTGSLAGGAFGALILALVGESPLLDALTAVKSLLTTRPRHDEVLTALDSAERLATSGRPHHEAIADIGEGWTAEEALAIAIYCALVARDFRHGVLMAVNHGGDSDSTGAITGNLLGAMHGVEAIPAEWLRQVELGDVISELADDLFAFRDWDIDDYEFDPETERIWHKYPGF